MQITEIDNVNKISLLVVDNVHVIFSKYEEHKHNGMLVIDLVKTVPAYDLDLEIITGVLYEEAAHEFLKLVGDNYAEEQAITNQEETL